MYQIFVLLTRCNGTGGKSYFNVAAIKEFRAYKKSDGGPGAHANAMLVMFDGAEELVREDMKEIEKSIWHANEDIINRFCDKQEGFRRASR